MYSPAVDQVSIKTSHPKNYSPTFLAANTELQNTLSLSRDRFKSCSSEKAQASVYLRAAAFPDPANSEQASDTGGAARLSISVPSHTTNSLGPVLVRRFQLKTRSLSHSTKPAWTSFPASSSEFPKKMKGVIAFRAGRLIQTAQRILTLSSSNTCKPRRKTIREQKVRSASITNMHFFPSNYYLWKVLRIVISFKLPSFLGQLLSFEVFTKMALNITHIMGKEVYANKEGGSNRINFKTSPSPKPSHNLIWEGGLLHPNTCLSYFLETFSHGSFHMPTKFQAFPHHKRGNVRLRVWICLCC